MRNKFNEMMGVAAFRRFYSELVKTANFYMATQASDSHAAHATRLCLAYAFDAGLKAGRAEGETNGK